MSVYRNTSRLTKAVDMGGPHFFNIGETSEVNVSPEEEGIYFRTPSMNGDSIPMDLFHAYAQNDLFGRRVTLSMKEDRGLEKKLEKNSTKIQVIEHLASALHIAGISGATVTVENKNSVDDIIMPSTGPGVKRYVERLRQASEDAGESRNLVYIDKAEIYIYGETKKGHRTMIAAKPSDSLKIRVLSGKYDDLTDVGEEEFSVENAYAEADRYMHARPIARLTGGSGITEKSLGWMKYLYWKQASLRGYKGITDETYIIATPWDSAEDIKKKMAPEFREKSNEYLAHTVLDFMGELYMVGNCPVVGEFTLANTNHPARMSALKHFFREGALMLRR